MLFFNTLLLSTLIISSDPGKPTEIIGSAAMPDGRRHEILVEQPENAENPFGNIVEEAPQAEPTFVDAPQSAPVPQPSVFPRLKNHPQTPPIVSQAATTNPQQMNNNPLYYQDKIENTIYQDGNRLLDVQSIPIKDINEALTPNTQPTISDYPAF